LRILTSIDVYKKECLMKHFKIFGTLSVLFFLWFHAAADPIAVSQVSCDLSSATILFEYDETGGATLLERWATPEPYGNLHIDIDGIQVENQDLNGNGTIAAAHDGASASAEANGGFIKGDASAGTALGVATSHSTVSSYLAYELVNVSSLSLSMDIEGVLNLLSANPGESAFGYVDADFGFYTYDGASLYAVHDIPIFSREAADGDFFNSGSILRTLSLSYDFSSPYSGTLIIQNIAQAYAQAEATKITPVPEPSAAGFILMGIALLAIVGRYRKSSRA
jgi:hypothetical protein